MNIKQGTGLRLRGCYMAVAAALALSAPAHAVDFSWGNWSGSWDNTISYGISIRGEDPESRLVGPGNGGTGWIGADDDGNLNWESGDVFSNIIKGTSELGADNGMFGFFGRIKYWYDFELESGKQPHGHGPNRYQSDTELDDSDFANYAKFSGLELLDLFVYGTFDLGDYPLDLRLGRQVVNWGEATFIQGVNILNPIDVSAFRRPGAEIKEGLLPVSLIYGNLGLPFGFSLEAFYQFKWEETVIDGCGTYFSDLDFVAKGCNFATVPDAGPPQGLPFYLPDSILQGVNSVYKDPYVDEPSDSGQWGVALRNYVEAIDTEFGLYYQRLHSRTPVLAVNYTLAAASQSILGGNGVPVYYQVQYPEDIDIWGLSFATNIGPVAVSGEVSFKQDVPVSVNSTTILAGGLGSLSTLSPLIPPEQKPCLVNPLLIGQFGPRACEAILQFAANPLQNSGIALGWDRFDITQAQTTLLYFWDQGLGSERVTLIGELAWIGVDDLPALAVMPYGRNSLFGAPQTGLGGPSDEGFVTSNSWGYRIRAAAAYPNVFAGVELTPSIAWAHDVDGTSPTPAFIDGRKAFSVALGANYLSKYRASIAYTWFDGGYANTQTDRDFFSFSVAMDF